MRFRRMIPASCTHRAQKWRALVHYCILRGLQRRHRNALFQKLHPDRSFLQHVPSAPGPGSARETGRVSRRAGQGRACQQVLPMPPPHDVAGQQAGPARMGERALPHGRARRAMDRGRNPDHGRLPRGRLPGGPRQRNEEEAMRELVARYLSRSISRRGFLKGLTTAGVSLAAAESILDSLTPVAHAQETSRVAPEAVKMVEGTGAECFAEQLIASGVKYVFGNSASEDAKFYAALVDRPQLKYILTPHEGPGAAMAAGYVKASGEPAIVMQAAVVGLANAIGQMFNAYKEQTPLVFYSYRTDQTGRAGRDGFEEVANQEGIVAPLTKYAWLARNASMIPETVRRAFKAAWTPPCGPTYASWHSDLNDQRARAEVIVQQKVDPRMRVRPNPAE